jgi:hypothetical protein
MNDACCPSSGAEPIAATDSKSVLARSLGAKGADPFRGVVSEEPEAGKVWWCRDVLRAHYERPNWSVPPGVHSVVFPTSWEMTLGQVLLNVDRSMVIPYWTDDVPPLTSKYEDEQTCFVWAGKPQHGLGILHATLRHLIKEEGVKCRLIVYCNDESGSYVELMQRVSNEEWVEFRGCADNDDVRIAMAEEGHVIALPFTDSVGQPLQLIEGMVGGMVPIVPCRGGLVETAIMNRGSVYRWSPDPQEHAVELATKAYHMCRFRRDDPAGFEALAMSYRQVARMKYDWEVVGSLWDNYSRSVLDR